ncbi:Gldg family protein [Pedobacter psychroterrae]|uniref:ABC transporter permease n=1 Tax=Pedobacter psychroterrae TaxID=2530453 RepID=A0A4R0NJS3_9SPHI|nr:Gldg family protein [Pedobacter psychroterrae]TCD00962.1 ABC transporter permease [Pedobacter psychroterrae]
MRKIFKIAKLELNILFYSPVAWLVLAIFMVQCALSFLDNMQGTRTGISLGYYPGPITRTLFAGNSGLFTTIQGYIYLYIPILTMGLMSRETSSGSIKLLLSSPVKLRQIILGKYLAIIGYGLTLIGVLLIFVIIGGFFIKDVDLGFIFSGLLGLYLLICTYAAIGLFMSCLTNYQVVAAISTLAVFAVLRYVGVLWQEIDFVRDLTYFLSISGRTEKMVNGLITTKDLFYFLIIIASFLSLCVLRLKSERELKPLSVKVGRYAALLFGALLLGYITSRPVFTGYLDATSAQSLTLTKTSRDIIKKLDGDLKVTTYVNMLAPNVWYLLPLSRNNDLSRMEDFKRFLPGMKQEYVYYYQKPVDTNYTEYKYNPNIKANSSVDKIAEQMATNMGIDARPFIPPAEIKKQIDLEPEGYLHVRKLEYKGKSEYLRFFMGDMDPYATEAEVSAALKRLLIDAPKVVFLTGNNERATDSKGDRDYHLISSLKTKRTALINQGFDVDTLNLGTQEIGATVDIVVLADPTEPFTAEEQHKLSAYIERGGNMLIIGEPGRQDILNPFLATIGLQLKQGILVKPDKALTPGFINATFSPLSAALDSNFTRLQQGQATVAVQGASAISYTPSISFSIKPLLLSTPGGWNKQLAAAQGNIDLTTANLSFNAAQGDEMGVFPIAISMSRKINNKEQRIVVSGDADFISNGELSRTARGKNQYYLNGVFRWLGNGDFPVDVSRPAPKDTDLKVSREQITALMWLCKGIIPAVIAILGAIVLFKRRRK